VYSLFIDTTSGLEIGLLDSNFLWLEYTSLKDLKPSEVIHHKIFELLKKYNLSISQIRCFFSSGPGSYTGMRLSEGLAQVFEMSGMSVYSFYHFEVPKLIGIFKGFWATNAFKGQVFIYNWDENTFEKELITKELLCINDANLGFTIDNTDINFSKLASTKELIKNQATKLFPELLKKNMRVGPYYFRTLDEEFR